MTIRLSADNFKDIIDLTLSTIPGGYMVTSFKSSISHYWIDLAHNNNGKKFCLIPDRDTFKENLSKLYLKSHSSDEDNPCD